MVFFLAQFILIFNILMHVPVTYNNYNYPPWAINLGIFIGTLPLLCIPGYMLYHFIKHIGSCQVCIYFQQYF